MTSLKQKRFVDTDYLQENVVERLEILENVSERNNMEYSTDNGIVHCKDTIKGRVNDLAIEGNTMVNYCTDGSKTLTLNGDINEVGTNITTTNAVNNGLVDVMCEGETLVNVCNQKDPIAITKSYTVENTNHVPLQGEYDGKARPVVEGNTLVNIHPKSTPSFSVSDSENTGYNIVKREGYIKVTGSDLGTTAYRYVNMGQIKFDMFKPNTVYTLVFTKLKGASQMALQDGNSKNPISNPITIQDNVLVYTFRTKETYVKSSQILYLWTNSNLTTIDIEVENPMIFEGDLSANPPSGYIEGLKSSFEDQLVTNENDPNYGKYKVEYKVTGKNKLKLDDLTKSAENGTFTLNVKNNVVTATSTKSNTSEEHIWTSPITIYLEKGKTYTMSFKSDAGEGTKPGTDTVEMYLLLNGKYDVYYRIGFKTTFTPSTSGKYFLRFDLNRAGTSHTFYDIQIEEGTTATTYEAYKEYTKTFYLNSPLLEGDTIEDVNGKATHVKRYGKTILDGDENWSISESMTHLYASTPISILAYGDSLNTSDKLMCDKLPTNPISNNSNIGICSANHGRVFRIRVTLNDTVDSIKAWLKANPITVVYQLASPIYEKISEESILTDSYVNGHLDLDTNVTVNKVDFKNTSFHLAYIQPSTPYTIQFTSDNIGIVEMHGGDRITTINVVKGINKVVINSRDDGNTYWNWTGIGFNASNISVVATEREFNYFEGLSSVGQDNENGHNIEIKAQNKNVLNLNDVTRNAWGITVSYSQNVVNINGTLIEAPNELCDYYLVGGWNEDTDNLNLKPNTKYMVSGNVPQGVEIYIIHNGKVMCQLTNNYQYNSFTNSSHGKINAIMVRVREGYTFSNTKINLQIEEGSVATSYVPHTTNTKQITLSEPLRALPNGVKDKFVKMNNKWYIERNCGEVKGSDRWYKNNIQSGTTGSRFKLKLNECKRIPSTPLLCNLMPWKETISYKTEGTYLSSDEINDYGVLCIRLADDIEESEFKSRYKNLSIIYPLQTPIYEELTVDPTLTTYVEQTHISTNSVIPCDMKVKNSGYSTIIKPSTLYTVALDTNKSGEVKVNLGGAEKTTTNNVVTLTTPSTLVDNELRISGKGLTSTNVRLLEGDKTNFIPSYFEGLKSSFEEKQGDNHIVEVISNNKNLFDINSWSDLENCKVDTTLGTVTITGTNNDTYTFTGATGSTTCSLKQRKYLIKVKPNTNYTLSTQVEGSAGRLNYVQFYDGDYYSLGLVNFGTTTEDKSTFTTPLNCKYIGFRVGVIATNQTLIYSNIQLEQNSTNTSYVENKSNKIQFSTLAPLRSVGDISDKLVYKDNKWMIERNIGILNFKDLGTWYIAGDNGYRADIRKGMGKFITDKPDLAIFSAYASSLSWDKPYMGRLFHHANHNEIIVTRPTGTTLEEFHKSIQENEEFMIYVLKEPTYEEIGEYKNLDSYDEGTTIYANTLIAPKNLSFNLATHMSNIVKDVQDDVSDLKTWRSEVFDSITHKKTFDSGFTTIEDTKEGVIDEVKLEGKTLVNLALPGINPIYFNINMFKTPCEYTVAITFDSNKSCTLWVEQVDIWKYVYHNDSVQQGGNYVVFKFNSTGFDLTKSFALSNRVSGVYDSTVVYSNIKMVILEGDHTQNPPSYFEGLKSVGEDVEEISVESVKNLLDYTKLVNKVTNGTTGYISINNNRLSLDVNDRIEVYSPHIYVKCRDVLVAVIGFVEKDGVPIYDSGYLPLNTISNLSLPSEVKYITINAKIGNETPISKEALKNVFIYHQSDKKPLLYYNEETQTWEKPILREWDSIEKHSDGKYYYHKRSGEVVLNGSEDWKLNTSSQTTQSFRCSYNVTMEQNLVCDRFMHEPISSSNGVEGILISKTNTPNEFSIEILKTRLTEVNVQGFKQWLQANNVTVVYQLAQEKVYEVFNLELNSYDGETNVIVNSGAISPITTVSLTSNLPQVAENLKNRVRQLEAEIYNYKVTQNLRQLRTFYKSDYANFGVSIVNDFALNPTEVTITPYALDLFEIFKEVIAQGKDKYDRIELEEYIDFYLMTFVFDFDMVFELFDLLDANEDIIEDEPVEEEPPMEEEEEIVEDTPTILPLLPEDEEVVEDTPTILPILPEDEATIIPLI